MWPVGLMELEEHSGISVPLVGLDLSCERHGPCQSLFLIRLVLKSSGTCSTA